MKLMVNLSKKHFLFMGYIAVIIIIWFFLPNTRHDTFSLFTSPMNRLLLILTFSAVIWLIYEQLIAPTEHGERENYNPALFNRFNNIVALLKRLKTEKKALPFYAKRANKKIRLYDLPWILTMGPPKTGKTTLLAQSGLPFILKKKSHQSGKKISSTQYCDWWATPEAVIIDMAGSHAFLDNNQSSDLDIWNECLSLLQKKRRPAFNSVVFYLSIKQLSSLSQVGQNQLFSTFKKRLVEIQAISLKPLPLYIILTQTDCLNGFHEYFHQASKDQLEKPWGIPFSTKHISNSQRLLESFDKEFEKILLNLHAEIIEKLHHEPNHDVRCLIKEFPLQLETLKKPIARLLQYLGNLTTNKGTTCMQGIFFTASGKKKIAVDRLLAPISTSFSLAPLQRHLQSEHSTYFVKGVYNDVIFPQIWKEYLLPGTSYMSARTRNILSASTALGLIIACTFIWSREFSTNIQSLSQVDHTISHYHYARHNASTNELNDSIKTLSTLKQAHNFLKNQHFPWLLQQKFFTKKDNLQSLVEKTYKKAMVAFLFEQVTDTLQAETNEKEQINTEHLYQTLKIYLSFNSSKQHNKNRLALWLQKHNKNNTKSLQQFNTHLQSLEIEDYQTIKLDPVLIQTARNLLNEAPRNKLAMIMLKNELTAENANQIYPLAYINNMVPTIKEPEIAAYIPSIYTRDYFLHTYEDMIPMAATMAMQGNWVTGEYTNSNINYQQLISQTNDLYFDEYIQAWENVLNQLQLTSFSSFKHAIQVLDNIVKPNSNLQKLLKTIYYHTNVTYNNINTPISIRFQRLQKLFSKIQGENITLVNANLLKLQELLANITNTPNSEATAYQIARNRMQNNQQLDIFDTIELQAITTPEPLRGLLMQINQNSWQLILSSAKNHINHAWQQKVLPYYAAHIKDRYPIQPNAKSEIRPGDFAEFFGPAGVIDSFYLSYLSPFIDKDQTDLYWRKRNGESLSTSNSFLHQITRSIMVKNAFFPDEPRLLKTQFSINPIVLQPVIKSMQFDLDDQHANFSQHTSVAKSLNWPGKQPLHIASITLTSVDGEQVKKIETGAWSWFKLLDAANLEEKETNNIIATFDINGYGAQCEIRSEQAINPFSPSLLPHLTFTEIA